MHVVTSTRCIPGNGIFRLTTTQPLVGLTPFKCVERVPKISTQASEERRNDRGRRGNSQPDQNVDDPASTLPTQNDTTNTPHHSMDVQELIVPATGSVTQNPPSVSTQVVNEPVKQQQSRRRIVWTTEMNKNIMRYFRVTNLERDTALYADKLQEAFVAIYPHLSHIPQKRAAMQKNVILRNNLLPEAVVDILKEEVEKELQEKNVALDRTDNRETLLEPETPTNNSSKKNQPRSELRQENPIFTKMSNTLEQLLIEYDGIDPKNRQLLPKLNYNSQTNALISTINRIIETKPLADYNMIQLHLRIYCAARTVLSQNQKLFTSLSETSKKIATKPKWQLRLENKIKNLRRKIGITTALSNHKLTNMQKTNRHPTKAIYETTYRTQTHNN